MKKTVIRYIEKNLWPKILIGLLVWANFLPIPMPWPAAPVLRYPSNLFCHVVRDGDYYWNNPYLMRCVNTEAWSQALGEDRDCDGDYDSWCNHKWWAIYRNTYLDDFGGH
jgi:hypothetical protein